MATKIRLKRIGRRNRPFYRLVVMDTRTRRDGAAIEELGWYDPIIADKEKNYSLNEERIMYWLGEGAQTSDITHHLLKRAGIAFRWHLMSQGMSEKNIEKEMQKWALNKEDAKKKLKSDPKKKATLEAETSEEKNADAPKAELAEDSGKKPEEPEAVAEEPATDEKPEEKHELKDETKEEPASDKKLKEESASKKDVTDKALDEKKSEKSEKENSEEAEKKGDKE